MRRAEVVRQRHAWVAALLWLACQAPAVGQAPAAHTPVAPRQTQADDYTSYELLTPESRQFRILYDVTARSAGATVFLNPIRPGSVASDERIVDLASGRPLPFAVVSGAQARTLGLPNAALEAQFLRIELARPVPANGEQRLRIDKTYKDPESYRQEGDEIVFTRSLGIRRNKVVLPAGYEIVACNTPVQVFTEDDGRVAVSFVNVQPGQVGLELRGRRRAGERRRGQTGVSATPRPAAAPAVTARPEPTLAASATERVSDRAFQDREIT